MTVRLPFLPPNTIVPISDKEEDLSQYFNRLYEEIAYNVNARDFTSIAIAVSTTAIVIPLLPTFGAFLVTVYGVVSSQPTLVAALSKPTDNIVGVITAISTQPGTGTWLGSILTISSNMSHFLIAHNNPNVIANFRIRIIGF